MKKLLLVTQGFPFGNSERGFLDTEYKYLKKRFEVYTLAITDMEVLSDEHAKVIHDYKVSVIEFISQIKRKEVLVDIKMAAKDAGWGVILRRIKRIMSYSARAEHMQSVLERIIREKGIDVIYTYWCLPATVAACRLKDKYNFSVVTRFHGFDLYKFREPTGWQPLRNYIANQSSLLVFACNAAKQYWLNEIVCCPEKTIVAYIGSKPCNRIALEKNDILKIVSCSNNIPLKRVSMIAHVVNLISRNIKVEWHHIGGPAERYAFLDEKNTPYYMYGTVEHSLVKDIYINVKPDIFITLTTTEGGTPVSIQEAMSMGIPALGTNVGGISELIEDGVNGFLVPVDVSETEVAKIIVEFSKYTLEARKDFSDNAYRKWKNNFNSINNSKEFLEILLNLSL